MEEENKVIYFRITVAEASLIFKALGTLPFADVYELIGKLNEQANHQLASSQDSMPNNPQ